MFYNTKIVNLISGPGSGKSAFTGLILGYLKMNGYSAEIVYEYAKQLVWLKKFDELNNQYHVSSTQYNLFKSINGSVEYVITDGSLLHGLIYNKTNTDNVCDVFKTEQAILKWYNEFNNVNIFLERNEKIEYEQNGRIQTLEESKKLDELLKSFLNFYKIPFYTIKTEDFDVRKNNFDINKILNLINQGEIK